MRVNWHTGDDGAETVDSPYGSPRHSVDEESDEFALYGAPRHEVTRSYDEERLYGEPQHERVSPEDVPDSAFEFARIAATRSARPTVPSPTARSETEQVTVERP